MKIEDCKVGLKVTNGIGPGEIKFVGRDIVLVDWHTPIDSIESGEWPRDLDVIKTYPELWLNVYQNDGNERVTVRHACTWPTLAEAKGMTTPDVVARIHLATDGTLTLVDL